MSKKEKYRDFFLKNKALQEVLQGYCDDWECEQIAKIRGTKPKTTKTQAEMARKVFGAKTIARAVACALKYEIIVFNEGDDE
jgi:hypothetical protein